ncbi:MAG: hypothetical protein M3Q13_02830 [Pseudomonadota bacterium]|nr:hypothetical protein [Pseudomonadota bacterium]
MQTTLAHPPLHARLRMSSFGKSAIAALLVFIAVLLVQWPLARNPGYFSHDELQWAVFAADGAGFDFGAWRTFQYRPLTFGLWSWLSRALFEQPAMFHTVLVAIGAFNAALLMLLGRRMGLSTRAAVIGAVLFALGPFAMYVHGWVGTIADLLWVGCALLLGVTVAGKPATGTIVVASVLLTTIALLAKEAAVSIPALLAIAWWCFGRARHWGLAAMASSAPVILYLLARVSVLLSAGPQGSAYDWSLGHIPLRWLEYQLFVPNITLFETANALKGGFGSKRLLLASILWLAAFVVLYRVGWRWALAWLVGGIAALGPVLVLGAATNHYGYAFAALGAMLLAAAWPRTDRIGRGVIVVLAVLNLWHGINVMREMRRVGEVQAVFSPAVVRTLDASATAATPLQLELAPDASAWVFARLLHNVPSYQRIPLGGRVQLVPQEAQAEYRIEADGTLTRLAR